MSYSIIVLVHIISASAFVMTMVIMQFVVANIMKRIDPGQGKQDAIMFIKYVWHPVVDTIIVLLGITGGILAFLRWDFILHHNLFRLKFILGVISLSAAYANHFVFRYVKRRKEASLKKETASLNNIKIVTAVLDKVALGAGLVTALIGWYINHG